MVYCRLTEQSCLGSILDWRLDLKLDGGGTVETTVVRMGPSALTGAGIQDKLEEDVNC